IRFTAAAISDCTSDVVHKLSDATITRRLIGRNYDSSLSLLTNPVKRHGQSRALLVVLFLRCIVEHGANPARKPYLRFQEKFVKMISSWSGSARALVISMAIGLSGSQPQAEEAPPSLKPILGTQTASPAEIGTKNILQLNASMFELYGASSTIFQ